MNESWEPGKNFLYFLFFKPFRVLCQFSPSENKATLKDYIDVPGIYPVGRLDYDSEGLLLLTNDTRLNHLLTHPRHHQSKKYWVQVEGVPTEAGLRQLREGVLIAGQRTLPAEAERIEDPAIPPRDPPIRFRASIPTSWLELTIREGRNRQVRHMTAAVGTPTLRLIRTRIGPLERGELEPGELRPLSGKELESLAAGFGFPKKEIASRKRSPKKKFPK